MDLGLLFVRAPRSVLSPRIVAPAYGAAFIVLTWVSLLRQSGASPTNTAWADDGTFYTQALEHSFFSNLFTQYNDYLQLFPRLSFGVVAALPPADMAATVAIVGAATLALLALVVFHASRGVIPSVAGRSLLVGAMVLLPLATGEMLNNIVNVSWWLFFVAFWALLWRPRTVAGTVAAAAICFVATGSEPLVAVYVPLALARLDALGWREGAPPLGLGLGLVYQLVGVVRAGHNRPFVGASTHGILQIVGTRLGLGWLSGNSITDHFVNSTSWVWPVLGTGVLCGVLALANALCQRRVLVFVATSLVFAVLTLAVPVWSRGVGPLMLTSNAAYAGRYVATPILLVWGAVIVEATSVPTSARFATRNLGIVLCCASLVPIWAIDFRTPNRRSDGPLWSSQVVHTRLACSTTSTREQRLDISPAGWYAVVPCSDLVDRPGRAVSFVDAEKPHARTRMIVTATNDIGPRSGRGSSSRSSPSLISATVWRSWRLQSRSASQS